MTGNYLLSVKISRSKQDRESKYRLQVVNKDVHDKSGTELDEVLRSLLEF